MQTAVGGRHHVASGATVHVQLSHDQDVSKFCFAGSKKRNAVIEMTEMKTGIIWNSFSERAKSSDI